MTHAHSALPLTPDAIWPALRAEAEVLQKTEPLLAALAEDVLLSQESLQNSLSRMLSAKLAGRELNAATLYGIFTAAHRAAPRMEEDARYDLISSKKHDPAARDFITPFLFLKGFHALQSYRVSHRLWLEGRKYLALYLQNRISDLFSVDIHPAAKIGHGVMMDHATGIVIGETAVVEDDVLFWHGVTLGGKGFASGDRHPKIRKGAQLGAGSAIMGAIEIGAGTRVATGSVVLDNMPAGVTVAGIPAKVVSKD